MRAEHSLSPGIIQQPPWPNKGRGQENREKPLAVIVEEVRWLLTKKYDQQQVDQVLAIVAEQFKDALIKSYLPVLVLRKATELLQEKESAPPSTDARLKASSDGLNFLRFEFKYLLRKELRDIIEKEIGNFMMLDPFVARQPQRNYIVRSLYYDDPSLSSYHQKMEGMLLRSKFRLRTYTDNPEDTCSTYLEVKGRYNSLVFKHRAGFDIAKASRLFADCASTTEGITRHIVASPVADQFRYELEQKKIAPVMLIDYIRRPYFSKYDPDFRLTLDDHLYATRSDHLFPSRPGIRREFLPGYTVMEIKFKNSIPLWFHRIIKNHSLKQLPISKICKGIEAWNLVPTFE